MIVVDANVIIYAIVESPKTVLAKRIAAHDAEWVVPPLWRYECTSALATLVRAKALDMEKAIAALAEAHQLTVERELAVDQEEVINAAIRFNLSAYDAQYVALALNISVQCVTADIRIIANASGIAVSLEQYLV
ncbi:MAG TPA: type II toxin-antitoxin system VapC family toxin [Tepidisphaeraceae bacterium]|nr:type II toxin-antitoxin system VapC family toxin [Tepidisphaeraceae bacterium]